MRPETVIQREVRKVLAQLGFEAVHVPNGAVLAGDPQQRARQMKSLKADGLMVGFPDLLVYGTGGRIGHFEIKTAKGGQNDNQVRTQTWMQAWGHKYAVVRSASDAVDALEIWGWI